jgi:hypothetical protein
MSIDPYSTSYPFLAIAQRHGVSYGDVLSYADHVQRKDGNATPDALLNRLSWNVRLVVTSAMDREHRRQAEVLQRAGR